MNRLFTVLLLFVGSVAFAQNVSNVKSSRDGEDFYTIAYYLDRDAADVKISVSLDGGKTFSQPLKEVFGDVGRVPSGIHTIYWNIKSEMADAVGTRLIFKVSTETSSACSEQIKLPSTSTKPSSRKDYSGFSSASMTRVGSKVLFQLEGHGGMGFDIYQELAAAPVGGSVGVMIRGKKRGHFIGMTGGYDFSGEVPYVLWEYRFCRNDVRGFWFGANMGVCGEWYRDNYGGYYETLPSGHLLAGYNITKWLNFRLAIGFPDIVSGSLAINIPNMFYKLR